MNDAGIEGVWASVTRCSSTLDLSESKCGRMQSGQRRPPQEPQHSRSSRWHRCDGCRDRGGWPSSRTSPPPPGSLVNDRRSLEGAYGPQEISALDLSATNVTASGDEETPALKKPYPPLAFAGPGDALRRLFGGIPQAVVDFHPAGATGTSALVGKSLTRATSDSLSSNNVTACQLEGQLAATQERLDPPLDHLPRRGYAADDEGTWPALQNPPHPSPSPIARL